MAKKRQWEILDDPLDPDFFRWPVEELGYRVEEWAEVYCEDGKDTRSEYGPFLVTGHPSGPNVEVREYDPLAVPELFRTFADLRIQDEDAVVRFATQYGRLGKPHELAAQRAEPDRWAEGLQEWEWESGAMQAMVGLWDTICSGNESALRRVVVHWDEPSAEPGRDELERAHRFMWELQAERERIRGLPPKPYRPVGGWFLMSKREDGEYSGEPFGIRDELLRHGTRLSRRQAAWRFLVLGINKCLQDNCAPCLYPRSRRPDSYLLRLAPKNLLGAMWWQFARVVTGESRHRPCRVCQRPIEISTGGQYGFRADREFCSGTCKVRDHRRKVREAKAMKARGRTVPQIAKHFDTSTDVIRNWLTKKK